MAHLNEKLDFVVEVFVVYQDKVLLRLHDKYKIWLSVGGHIDPGEDPTEAALREVKEEVGLDVVLFDGNQLLKHAEKENRQLVPPVALGRHTISETHEHVVNVYFATATTDAVIPEKSGDVWRWATKDELQTMELRPDILFYAQKALEKLSS